MTWPPPWSPRECVSGMVCERLCVCSQVQQYWLTYMERVDRMVEEALRLAVKRSLQELSKAINGDSKALPDPLFRVQVVLRQGPPRAMARVAHPPHTSRRSQMQIDTPTHSYTQGHRELTVTHTNMHTETNSHPHHHINAHINTQTQKHTQTNTSTHNHTSMHINNHTHSHITTQTHTHTHRCA